MCFVTVLSSKRIYIACMSSMPNSFYVYVPPVCVSSIRWFTLCSVAAAELLVHAVSLFIYGKYLKRSSFCWALGLWLQNKKNILPSGNYPVEHVFNASLYTVKEGTRSTMISSTTAMSLLILVTLTSVWRLSCILCDRDELLVIKHCYCVSH